jgi:hypothetical protein
MGGDAGDAGTPGTPGTLPPKTYREGGGPRCVGYGDKREGRTQELLGLAITPVGVRKMELARGGWGPSWTKSKIAKKQKRSQAG